MFTVGCTCSVSFACKLDGAAVTLNMSDGASLAALFKMVLVITCLGSFVSNEGYKTRKKVVLKSTNNSKATNSMKNLINMNVQNGIQI